MEPCDKIHHSMPVPPPHEATVRRIDSNYRWGSCAPRVVCGLRIPIGCKEHAIGSEHGTSIIESAIVADLLLPHSSTSRSIESSEDTICSNSVENVVHKCGYVSAHDECLCLPELHTITCELVDLTIPSLDDYVLISINNRSCPYLVQVGDYAQAFWICFKTPSWTIFQVAQGHAGTVSSCMRVPVFVCPWVGSCLLHQATLLGRNALDLQWYMEQSRSHM
mmetsp:Transcript_32011/g.73080  ORF Transcript_32011/g.73080 Transcript_32011/m.73080 type:complete len:221 (-) Transcript_32011:101-763(-)